MDFKVLLVPAARDDLEDITGHISKDNEQAAERFGNELINRTLSLAQFPQMERIVPEIDDPEIREIIHNPYRIVYRVRPVLREIYILRFWHAARGEPFI